MNEESNDDDSEYIKVVLNNKSIDRGVHDNTKGNVNDYEQSISNGSQEYELESQRKRRRKNIVYNSACDHKKVLFALGIIFENKIQVKKGCQNICYNEWVQC